MLRPVRWLVASTASLSLLWASGGSALAETLPTWVQNHRPTTLWSGPDGRSMAFGGVPVWSGFQVLGAQGERLFVRYLGDGVDRETGVAWVDRVDVGPTDRPLLWVASRGQATLWSGPDEGAVVFGFAPETSLMVRLEAAANGRAQVFFLGNGAEQPAGLAWADLAALQPALAPSAESPLWQVWGRWEAARTAEARRLAEAQRLAEARRPAAPPLSALSPPAAPRLPDSPWSPVSTADRQRFIEQVASVARRLRTDVGLPPSLVVAMAINESGWGRSALTQQAHNYFGIKAYRGQGTAGVIEFDTWEVVDGRRVAIRAPFRAYHSLEESVRDLGAFLRSNQRYEPVWRQVHDPQAAARILAQAGYATDPAWADKLLQLMARYNLQQFDRV